MILRDQMGRTVVLPSGKKDLRIVSIVPSQTELLHSIGANVVAQTIFCVHPKKIFKRSVKVGGTKRLHIDKIRALSPDLIIGNKEENEQEQINELALHFPVWMSDIHTLQDALDMIGSIGHITGKVSECNALINKIEEGFDKLKSSIIKSGTVAYLIWNDPHMLAGQKTFINEMLRLSGLTNIDHDPQGRYPQITMEALSAASPDFLFLSSEPFPFKEEHAQFFREKLPETKVFLVDGEYFSWYGSRLVGFPEYLRKTFPSFFRN